MVGIVLDCGREQSIDERRLAQTRLSGNLCHVRSSALLLPTLKADHDGKACASFRNDFVTDRH